MAPKSSKERWETYEQEFAAWLKSEIEITRHKLEDLLKIKKRLEGNNMASDLLINDLSVVSVEATMFKVDGGHDGNRFECVLCIQLSDGRYHEIEVESMTNPREWTKEIVK